MISGFEKVGADCEKISMYLVKLFLRRQTGRKRVEAIKAKTRKELSMGLSEKWIDYSNASFCTFSPVNKKIDKIKSEAIQNITYHLPEKNYIMKSLNNSE